MSNPEFRFKKFVVQQDKCAMKVGTDGVLLGAWVEIHEAKSILDIGTGTGLIALMMAQKSEAKVDSIDIDESAFIQAKENFESSPWPDRLTVFHESLQHYRESCKTRYDLIVSNPPYFMDAHPAPSEARNVARHMDESLSMEELTSGVLTLLAPGGRFCVIFPQKEATHFLEYATVKGLYPNHITRVKTKVDKQEKRLMIELSKTKVEIKEDEIVIQEDLNFTQQYIDLTEDFYLGLKKERGT